MVKIGLCKGNLIGKSQSLIERVLDKQVNSRQLHFADEVSGIEFYLLKHRDIPGLVADGVLDAGITTGEWIVEQEREVVIVKELNWCDSRISLLSASDSSASTEPGLSFVTEYPNIAKKFLANSDLNNYTIKVVSGSCEALTPNIFDYAIGCIQTGSTAKLNNLHESEVILHTKTCIIANVNSAHKLRQFLRSLPV